MKYRNNAIVQIHIVLNYYIYRSIQYNTILQCEQIQYRLTHKYSMLREGQSENTIRTLRFSKINIVHKYTRVFFDILILNW